MTNEEFERRMEFFLNQQARFDAGLHDLRQEVQESIRSTNQSLAQTADTIARLSLVMFEGFKVTDERLKALAESQALTEERLQHLMATFDRHISDGHAGA